jgi:hypothetical protein
METSNKQSKQDYFKSEAFFEYASELEKYWKGTQQKLNEKEMLEVFPNAKEVIPDAIKNWQEKYDELANEIKSALSKVSKEEQWFSDILFEKLIAPKLLKIEDHIFRLKRQLSLSQGPQSTGHRQWKNFQEMLDIAKTRPLYEFARDKLELKPSGKNFVGLCPFHNERTPSCYFYTETNTFYCFGCGEKGDIINFTMRFYGIDFKEAVKMLQ